MISGLNGQLNPQCIDLAAAKSTLRWFGMFAKPMMSGLGGSQVHITWV